MSLAPLIREPDQSHSFDISTRGDALIGQKMFEVLELARQVEAEGHYVYHLELGDPRLPPPPELIEATVRSLQAWQVGYTSSAGHPPLRQAIAAAFSRTLTEANVVVSPGNLLINQFLDLVCDRGDTVVFFTPAFPTYWAAAAHIGLRVLEVPLDPTNGFDLSEADVSRAVALRPRAIIVNSANNPTGAVYARRALERLAQECDRTGIWLLSDETYGPLCFGAPFFSLADLALPRLVVMSSFSKIFSVPGFRVGFALAHPWVARKLALSTSTLVSCLPIFTQLGCLAALDSFESYTAVVRQQCARVARQCSEDLSTAPGLRFRAPSSGFYLFLNISSTGVDDLTFARKLLQEKHTAITPGSSFGGAYRAFVRLATCGADDDVHEGIRRLTAFCGQFSNLEAFG